MKEQPNWVTEYNHYSEVQQKKDQALRIIKKLSMDRYRKKASQDKPNKI